MSALIGVRGIKTESRSCVISAGAELGEGNLGSQLLQGTESEPGGDGASRFCASTFPKSWAGAAPGALSKQSLRAGGLSVMLEREKTESVL